MKFKHCLEIILSNLNLDYVISLEANPVSIDEVGDLDKFYKDEIDEEETIPTYLILFEDNPIQIYCTSHVDMFKDDDPEEGQIPYLFQNIYEIRIYDYKNNFIDGMVSYTLDEIETLIKKNVRTNK
jgi:hypothetical protein